MTLTLRYAALSDRGLLRSDNQDSVYAGPRLLAVADGMGGMAAGDVASNLVIAALAPLDEDAASDAPIDSLRAAVDQGNRQLRETIDENPAMEGMGTTLTGMLFAGNKFALVHVGDSRAYLLRGGDLTQITRDDTYVQLLVDEGQITAEEANTHPQKSVIMRALDGREANPDYSVRQAAPGDRYLICSDGLSGVVSDETIAATMRDIADPHQCADRLMQLALRGGGPDNITVVIADVTDADIVEESPVVGGAAAPDSATVTAPVSHSTPASRASALSQPTMPKRADKAARARPRRRPLRALAVALLLLAVLAGGLFGAWTYTQSRYYVGVSDQGHVAIFNGVPGEIVGLSLSRVVYVSEVSLDELTPVAQQRVRAGIPAPSRAEADQQLAVLINPQSPNLLPLCPSPSPSPTASPSPTPPVSPSDDASASLTGAPSQATSGATDGVSQSGTTPSLTPSVDSTPTVLPSGPPDCRLATR